jgi:hypothetical protein
MVVWKEDIVDRHMEGTTPFGPVYIRFNRAGKTSAMYTLFGSTHKYIPDEEWMQDLEGAQLKLEEIVDIETKARAWSEGLRSKQ